MDPEPPFTPDTHIAEAGRAVLAGELDTVQSYYGALLQEAPVVAVHETRKAIRRTFTAVKLFRSFFEPGVLESYRRQLRKIMRRLGHCRDIAVFLHKLEAYEETQGALPGLRRNWQHRKKEADGILRRFLKKPRRQIFLEEYSQFTRSAGLWVRRQNRRIAPIKVRHLAPLLIQQRMAEVRAFDAHLADPSLERMHQLRIQFKELRYTLRFFAPVLGPEIEGARATLKEILDLLGALNDAKVALQLLDGTAGLETEVALYRTAKEDEISFLLSSFPQAWKWFDSLSWRQELSTATAVL